MNAFQVLNNDGKEGSLPAGEALQAIIKETVEFNLSGLDLRVKVIVACMSNSNFSHIVDPDGDNMFHLRDVANNLLTAYREKTNQPSEKSKMAQVFNLLEAQ